MLLALVPWFFVYPDFVNLARSSGCEDYVASGEIAVFQVWRRIAPGATQMPLSCWCDKYCMENGNCCSDYVSNCFNDNCANATEISQPPYDLPQSTT